MKEETFVSLYRKLNIPVEPLPSNYSPDEYGKSLMSVALSPKGVSYASSTDYKMSSQNNLIEAEGKK